MTLVSSLREICSIFEIADENCTCVYSVIQQANLTYCENQGGKEYEPLFIDEYEQAVTLCYAILSTIIVLVNIFGNSIILSVACTMCKDFSNCQMIILLMTVANLIYGISFFISAMQNFWTRKWVYGEWLCKILNTLSPLGCVLSIWFVVVVAAERYQGIVNPWKPMTTKTIKITVVTILIFSTASMSPLFIYYTVKNNICQVAWSTNESALLYHSYILVAMNLIPVCLTIFFYIKIIKTLNRSIVRNEHLQRSIEKKAFQRKVDETKRIAKIVIVLTTTFAFLVPPYQIFVLIVYAENKLVSRTFYWVITFISLLAYHIHAALHPFLFSGVDKRWKRRIKGIFRLCGRKLGVFTDSYIVKGGSSVQSYTEQTSVIMSNKKSVFKSTVI
jgi:7 transmembrane receptor (rhodopsin family).